MVTVHGVAAEAAPENPPSLIPKMFTAPDYNNDSFASIDEETNELALEDMD